ncbi:MAG TPA: hypothetical protein VFM59_04175 [Salinimicrobium sp.]|nr:hypothetical protein [Salinimicrobium sp.]
MKTITISLIFMIFSAVFSNVNAQTENDKWEASEEARAERREEIQQKIAALELEKEQIETEEKEALKISVEKINKKLEAGEITSAEAEKMKEEAAKARVLNIKNRTAIIDNKIELLERNGTEDFVPTNGNQKNLVLGIGNGNILKWESENGKKRYDRRTTSDIVIAFGFNNALQEGQALDDSDFKIAGSRFFEIGWAWKTRVFEKSDWLRFKYGVSFQFNGLKPTENRYFVEDGEMTVLEEFPISLDKAKFRMDNLVVPIHFEFGPYKKQESKSGVRFYTHDKIKIGLGGYAGLNIGERQKLKYEEDGENVKEKLKGSYNTNDVIYGLSGYVGWSGTALYVKYDLNPIFEEPNPELHNFSVGLRFDVD